MKAFFAITCSTCRVTNCSTSCAVAPGHAVEATATRTGILRILPLRHVLVAIPAPQAHSNQQDHRNLAVFREKTRRVMRAFDVLGF